MSFKKLFAIAVLGLTMVVSRNAEASLYFMDDFNGSLDSAWTVDHENTDYYSISNGILDIQSTSGHFTQSVNNYINLFLIDTPTTGDFMVTAFIKSYSPAAVNYAQFDLLAFDDLDNHVRCNYGNISGRRFEFGKEISGAWSQQLSSPVNFGEDSFYLRLKKVGNVYTQFWSKNGIEFYQENSTIAYGDGTPESLGFIAYVDPTQSSHAYIDWFQVTDLNGYTPEPVPEPASLVLLGLGSIALMRRKRK